MKAILIIILVLFIIMAYFSSCEVFHFRKSDKKETVSVSKTDSSRVEKKDSAVKTNFDYKKETVVYVPGRDTIISNFTTPINNYYPVQYTKEESHFSQDFFYRLIDSFNRSKKDTTKAVQENKVSESKTKVLNMFQVAGVCAATFIFLSLAGKVIHFRNPLKSQP